MGYVLLMSQRYLKFSKSQVKLIILSPYYLCLFSLFLFGINIHSYSSQSLRVHLIFFFLILHLKYCLFLLFPLIVLNNFLPLHTYPTKFRLLWSPFLYFVQ